MSELDLRPEALLPHDHPMILIDSVVDYGDDFTVATVTPAPGKPFADDTGNIPSWVGMEYMAQTIAAYAGIRAQDAGLPVKVGFLLGSRAYDVNMDQFESGQTYAITVSKAYEDDGLNAFDCSIVHYTESQTEDTPVLARATINTFQPDNIDEFMETSKG